MRARWPTPHASLSVVDHIGIAVRSIDAVLPEYVDKLGFGLIHDERVGHLNVRMAYLDAGDLRLQLVEPVGPCAVADFIARRGEGLHHICFEVADVEKAAEAFKDGMEGDVFLGGMDRRACFLAAQPNGVLFELIQESARGRSIMHGK